MKNLDRMYRLKQFMCALLVCVMTVSLLPVSAFAAQPEQNDSPAEIAPVEETAPIPEVAEPQWQNFYCEDELFWVNVEAEATRAELAQILMNFHKG